MTLRKIDQEELNETLRLHKLWLMDDILGLKANLRSCNLQNFDFRGVSLQYADLKNADLRGADLQGVVLDSVALDGADLRGAQFSQMIPHNCWIQGSKWLLSDLPWWLGHPQQDQVILCEE